MRCVNGGGLKEMKPLLEGAMELPFDKYRIRIDELKEENSKLAEEKAKADAENQELRARIKELELLMK